ERIERRASGAVRGVRLADGTRLEADVVVSDADPASLYRTLLEDVPPPRPVGGGRYSPSALVWHVGTRGRLPTGAAHHNIHFGAAWDEAFDSLFDGRRMP